MSQEQIQEHPIAVWYRAEVIVDVDYGRGLRITGRIQAYAVDTEGRPQWLIISRQDPVSGAVQVLVPWPAVQAVTMREKVMVGSAA